MQAAVPAEDREAGQQVLQHPVPHQCRRLASSWRWLMYRIIYGLALLLAASQAWAADVESGRRLAQQRCAACHIVTGSPRNDLVADAPPFLAIGRKYGFDTEALVFNLVGPHRKMNFALSRPEANDIAAYIQSLAR
jgi:mono/diheme cytochrome c family protein